MADLYTLNYGWVKPDPGADNDIWGDQLNADLDAIDDKVHSIEAGTTGVTSWNTRTGDVTMSTQDIVNAGGATAASVPQGATIPPAMDGTAAIGTSTAWAHGDHVHPTDTSLYPMSNPANYVNAAGAAAAAPVQSVAGKTGAVALAHTDIADWNATLAPYAPLASPTLTGAPKAPTPAPADNSTALATTAFVTSALAGSGAAYLPLAGGNMTGALALAADPASAMQAATKEYVDKATPVNVAGGFLNKLRNGTFDVWQRGTSGLSVPSGAVWTYTADGWTANPGGGTGTAQRLTTPLRTGALTQSALQLLGSAGGGNMIVQQRIEAAIAASLNGVPITFQTWYYNGTAAPITPTLTVQHATGGIDVWTSAATDAGPVNLQPCPVGQWVRLAYTFTVPLASLSQGISVQISSNANVGAGSSVIITEADLRATPGLPVGLCANPPPPELRIGAEELAFCQRYYETSYTNGIAPGTPNAGSGGAFYLTGLPSSTYGASIWLSYKVQKRITSPSILIYSPVTGAVGMIRNFVTNADVAASFAYNSVMGFMAYSAAAMAVGTAININAGFAASAEL